MMKSIKFFFFIYFLLFVSCKTTSSLQKTNRTVNTRLNLKMPKLLDVKRFKKELPLTRLKALQCDFKQKGIVTPGIDYVFIIDTVGNVVDGKFYDSNDKELEFFDVYVHHIFDTYKWSPAIYTNTAEKVKAAVKLSIYQDWDTNVFEVSIRLIYLPDREKIQDILDEKNLIYKFEIH